MTRDEFAWLVVRAVGAFFLLFIAIDLIALAITSVHAAITYNEAMSDSIDPDDVSIVAIRFGRLIGQIWSLAFEVILKAALSYYCFYHGAWIHKLLTSRLPSAEQS